MNFTELTPFFEMPKEFADQMENRGKDDIWELSVLATFRWIRRIYPVFLEFIEKKQK